MNSKAQRFKKSLPAHFVNKNIIHLRHELSKSQFAISCDLDISRFQYASYEEYRSTPNLDLTVKMAQYFKVKLEDFITKDLSKTRLEYIDKSFVQL